MKKKHLLYSLVQVMLSLQKPSLTLLLWYIIISRYTGFVFSNYLFTPFQCVLQRMGHICGLVYDILQ
jgi:hypothetical protein